MHFLTLATAETLATTAGLLVTVGLLLVMACVVAARLARTGRDGGGGPGDARTEPVPIPTGNPDAELLRILDDARLGDLRLTRRAPLHNRRGAV